MTLRAQSYRDISEPSYCKSSFYARNESSGTGTIAALIKKTFFTFPVTYNSSLQGGTRVGVSSLTPFPAGPALQLPQVAETGGVQPWSLRDPLGQGEMASHPPLPPYVCRSKPSSLSLSLYVLASTHHHHSVLGLALLWGSLRAPNWSQNPAVASPSLPLSCLAQPRAHTPVSLSLWRSLSCVQHFFCTPNFLP